jgi:cytochrome c biogenesis protein CcmG, thiol:disulfide interchange protein DsbE
MLRNILILIAALALGAGLTFLLDYTSAIPPMAAQESWPKPQSALMVEKALPEFSFTPLGDETPQSISSLRGKIIVLNFWASWCAPCLKEFPYFLQMAADMPDDFVFLALSSDHDAAAMERFLDKMRREMPAEMGMENVLIALDENASVTRGVFQTFRLPETILIDRNGIMREKLIGADWKYEDLKTLIEKIDTM